MLDVQDVVIEVLDERLSIGELSIEDIPEELMKNELGSIADPLGQIVSWLWGNIQSLISSLELGIRGLIRGLETALKPIIDNVYSFLVGTIYQAITSISSGISYVRTSISSIVSSVSSLASNVMSAVASISGTISGLSSAIQSVFSAIYSITSTISGYFASLSSVISGSITTIANSLNNLYTFLSSAFTSLTSTLVSAVTSAISSTISGIATAISAGFTQLLSSITGIVNVISSWSYSLTDMLNKIFGKVVDAVTNVGKGFGEFVVKIPEMFEKLYAWIEGGWTKFMQDVNVWWDASQKWLGEKWDIIVRLSGEVHNTLMGFINPLINIANMLKPFIDGVVAFLKDPFGTIIAKLKDIADWIASPFKPFIDGVVAFVKDPFGTLSAKLKEFADWIISPFKPFIDGAIAFLKDPFGTLIDKLKDFADWVVSPFKPFIDNISGFFKDPIKVFKDMLSGLWNYVSPAFTYIINSAKPTIDMLWNAISSGVTWIGQQLSNVVHAIAQSLSGLGTKVVEAIFSLGRAITDSASSFAGSIKNVISSMVTPVIGNIGSSLSSALKDLSNKVAKGEGKGEFVEFAILSGMLFSTEFVFRWMANILWDLGRIVGDIDITIDAALQPLGLGFRGEGRYKMTLGWILTHMARELQRYPDTIIRGMIYGISIWMSQPFSKLLNSMARDIMPIELPTISTLLDMVRRSSPTRAFQSMYDRLNWALKLYGYHSDFVAGYLSPPQGDWQITVYDRFNRERKIPRSLVYELPSTSELARMMVRDIFGPPLSPFNSFKTAIAMRGMTEDIAKMYYLLHFDYPPLEKLYEFACRCAVGMAWVDATPIKESGAEDLGASGVAPSALNANVKTIDDLKTHLSGWVDKYLRYYAKWHDYAQWSWIDGFTSDGLIMMDLMADIPQRIDARWMYKWRVIDDSELFQIVVARSMHPKWVEKITIAEALNALSEERTYLRTGVTNVFEIGYLTQKQLEDKLDKLETVTILGKNVDIKFLEGEKKLITQRHIWDRAYNILKSLWSSLTSGFARNQLSETEIMDTVKKTVDDIKGTLNIELTVDEKYLQSYLRSCDIRKQMETIQRLRYMTRIFIYRASQLAESGEKYEQLIDEFCEKAKLTDVEKEIMKLLGSAFIEYAKKNRKISIAKNVVKGKIRSGEWNTAQALEYLTKMGMDKDEASGWLEAEVKPRVVSIDKLVSMAEKIPVNVEILKQKMDAEGVPPNEQQLYLPYFVATELSEEMNSLANEYINQFVYGIINEEQLRSKLDELATLKGQAKTMYDVDWINISPRERELMVEKAKLLRDRRTYRPEGSKGLTSLHLVEATEYLPVSTDKLSEKFSIEGYPPDEQRILMNEAFAKEISEEMGRVATELVTDYVNGVIDETGLRKALDDLATLGGAVPKLLGVPWIVLSPVERDMFVNLAKLRRARAKAKK